MRKPLSVQTRASARQTRHLLASTANAAHLRAALKSAKQGKLKRVSPEAL